MYATCVQVSRTWSYRQLCAREWDSGPLGEQQLFLTAKPSLCTFIYIFIYIYEYIFIYKYSYL